MHSHTLKHKLQPHKINIIQTLYAYTGNAFIRNPYHTNPHTGVHRDSETLLYCACRYKWPFTVKFSFSANITLGYNGKRHTHIQTHTHTQTHNPNACHPTDSCLPSEHAPAPRHAHRFHPRGTSAQVSQCRRRQVDCVWWDVSAHPRSSTSTLSAVAHMRPAQRT